jgi:phage repressor protein C with HTH and peptisase S24 domain
VTPGALEALRALAADRPLVLRVAGTCMAPDLPDRAAVAVKASRFYAPGDIVAFADRSGRLVAHRAIGYHPGGGALRLWTQSDAADEPDAPVSFDRILGKVVGRVGLRQRLTAANRFLRVSVARVSVARLFPGWR